MRYTAQESYGFGSEVAKFEKIKSGPFGEAGDLRFTGTLAPAPVTDTARRQYERFLTQYILEKNQR